MSSTDSLREVMIALDVALTGKPEKDAAHMARNQNAFFDNPERFLESGGYYLSDGGYSRVFFDPDTETFRLSGISRDQVKARWHEADVKDIAARAAETLIAILNGRDPRPL
jgi:hypothetical protein